MLYFLGMCDISYSSSCTSNLKCHALKGVPEFKIRMIKNFVQTCQTFCPLRNTLFRKDSTFDGTVMIMAPCPGLFCLDRITSRCELGQCYGIEAHDMFYFDTGEHNLFNTVYCWDKVLKYVSERTFCLTEIWHVWNWHIESMLTKHIVLHSLCMYCTKVISLKTPIFDHVIALFCFKLEPESMHLTKMRQKIATFCTLKLPYFCQNKSAWHEIFKTVFSVWVFRSELMLGIIFPSKQQEKWHDSHFLKISRDCKTTHIQRFMLDNIIRFIFLSHT